MQNTVESIVASWFTDLPAAPAPVVTPSDPYADYERMSVNEWSQLINRRPWVASLTRKCDINTNPLQVQRVSRVEYHLAGHRHDPNISAKWANVDAGAKAQESTKKGKKK